MKLKKAQSEIVGFVLIVIIVLVALMMFFSFFLTRGKPLKHNSFEIENFLEAIMLHTTNCSINYGFIDMQELIKACYNNQNCFDGKKSCDVMKTEMEKIIVRSFSIENEGIYSGYNLSVYYNVVNSSIKDELTITENNFKNCSSKPGASKSIPISSNAFNMGYINVDLELCMKNQK